MRAGGSDVEGVEGEGHDGGNYSIAPGPRVKPRGQADAIARRMPAIVAL